MPTRPRSIHIFEKAATYLLSSGKVVESLMVQQGVEGGHFVLASSQKTAYRSLGPPGSGPAEGQAAFLPSLASHNLGIYMIHTWPEEHAF